MRLRRRRNKKPCKVGRPVKFECLENRLVLTSMLYLDFGQFFPTGGLQMSADELRDTFASSGIQGPDLVNDLAASDFASGEAITGGTQLHFDSLQTLMGDLDYDYDGTGGAGDLQDYTSLRDSVLSLVQRYYSPFDVNVVLAPTLTNTTSTDYLNGVRSTLQLGANTTGERDCWMFIADVTRLDENVSLGFDASLNGIATIDDIGLDNVRDDSALTFADFILHRTRRPNNDVVPLSTDPFDTSLADTYLAYTTAHEAAHNFGLEHTSENTADDNRLSNSDVIVVGADATNRENFAFFTRFDLVTDQPPPATVNNYERLADTDLLGLKSGPTYVTGTGTHDHITVTRVSSNTVNVIVQAYREDTFTTLLGTETLNNLNVANGLLIEAGFGDDLIEFDDFASVNITLRGMAGTDRIEVRNFTGTNLNYTPGTSPYAALDDSTSYGGTLAYSRTGDPTRSLSFDEFEPDSTLTLEALSIPDFTGSTSADDIEVFAIGADVHVDGEVNGQQFVPLIRVGNIGQTTLQINLRGGADDIEISLADTMSLGVDGGNGGDNYVVNYAGSGTGGVSITDSAGISDVEFNFTGNADAIGVTEVFGEAQIALGSEIVSMFDAGAAGRNFKAVLNGLGGSDVFDVNDFDKELVSDNVSEFHFVGGGGTADRVVLHDENAVGDLEYEILADSEQVAGTTSGHVSRTGSPLYVFRQNVEQVVLNAGVGSNNFLVTPSATAAYEINANLPINPLPPGVPGDSLEIDFSGTTTPQLSFTNQALGNGRWEFGNREDVVFTSIEKFNFFDVLAVASDAGAVSQPLVHVINAENGLPVSPAFLAYAATYRQGVRVAMGDMTGDGIPEVITAPGRSHAPTIKVFDILSGAELIAYRTEAYAPNFIEGIMLAVGDVTGDGKNDIVTAPSRGASEIKVFRNDTGAADPIVNAPHRWFHAFPSTFIGGSSLALGNINGANAGQEIVVGSGSGMRATVRVFDTTMFAATGAPLVTPPVFREYLPFEATFRGGITVAVGNALGDATPDIIVGAGAGGGGRIQIMDGDFGGAPTPANSRTVQLFNDQGFNSPVRVAISDFDNDGIVEVLAAQGADGRSGNTVRRYKAVDQAIDSIFQETDARFTGLFLGSALGA